MYLDNGTHIPEFCKLCSKPIPDGAGFCSDGCRDMYESETKRLNESLDKVLKMADEILKERKK